MCLKKKGSFFLNKKIENPIKTKINKIKSQCINKSKKKKDQACAPKHSFFFIWHNKDVSFAMIDEVSSIGLQPIIQPPQ
jgi:hypothetical protein